MMAMTLLSRPDDGAVDATLAMMRCRYRAMLAMVLPSLTGDGTAEATLAMARCHCQFMLVMVLLRRCCLWRDVAVESYKRWRCRDDISHGVISLSTLAGDGATESYWRQCF
jgi:hypothetical protein